MSNFSFLSKYWDELANLGDQAESYVYTDANASLTKMRSLGEKLVKIIYEDNCGKEAGGKTDFYQMTVEMEQIHEIPAEIASIIHHIRKCGNKASHQGEKSIEMALSNLKSIFRVCIWFMQIYGDYDYKPNAFVEPKSRGTSYATASLPQSDIEDINEIKELIKESEESLQKLYQADIIMENGRLTPGKHSVAGKSTITGFTNTNDQINKGRTDYDGTDYGQKLYCMVCMKCNRRYYVNGSTIYNAKCPNCMGGKEVDTCGMDGKMYLIQDNETGYRVRSKTVNSVAGKSTTPGFINDNSQKNIMKTEYDGTDYGQKLYQMECQYCRKVYYVNGSTIYNAKCPNCMGGKDIIPVIN